MIHPIGGGEPIGVAVGDLTIGEYRWLDDRTLLVAGDLALFDKVLQRPELDGGRTALLGASFGGFMANWIAGHTDRFACIVSHAGLRALDQQHRTTDAAAGKMRVHLHEDDKPEWYHTYSPHHNVDRIKTPMLITHGNRDYRVPISEALRLWWDLVSGWNRPPETMPIGSCS